MVDEARQRVVVALDYPAETEALALLDRLGPARVKIGKELFTSAGPAVVEAAQARGFEVFLDLKYHDIPNTVAGACRAAAALGVWMVNVHALGGTAMMRAAREAVDDWSTRTGRAGPLLIAVTVLTSHDDESLRSIGIEMSSERMVERLARLAERAGMDGVVCSPREAALVKDAVGDAFLTVTPGIRPLAADADDQVRIATPAGAVRAGADFLVVGRPITRAADPEVALAAIAAEIAEVN